MKKFSSALMVGSILTAAPALAQDTGVYLGLGAGVVEAGDVDFENTAGDVIADTDYGWQGEALVGYDAGPVRFEVEGSYTNFDLNALDAGTVGVPANATDLAFGPQSVVNGEGEIWSGMLNALIDIGGNGGIGFSVGGGVGISNARFVNVRSFATGPGFIDDSDARFAWQGVAQVYAPLTESIDASLKYKYHNVDGPEYRDGFGRTFGSDLATHAILGTVIFNFGGAAPEIVPPPPMPVQPVRTPPPVAQPVTPPTPQPRACNTGPYIVFFDWDEAAITPEAATVLNSATTAYRDCGTARVMLAGHADRSGAPAYNVALSQRRNAAVRDYLSGRGIPAARIASEAFGETQNRVATADGVRELQNRRVEVSYGPGSGN